jgi:aminoglycoside phosphotransferase (APT) family kinase protein
MEDTIKKIVQQEFSVPAITIKEILDRGLNNQVFYITTEKHHLILRMKKSLPELETYQKEKWCAEAAKNAGVPTPKILKVGIYGDYSFSFQEYVDGVDGNDAEDKAKIWYTLGQYAKTINSIPAKNLTLDYKIYIPSLFAEDFFVTNNIFDAKTSSKIQQRVEESCEFIFPPKLSHRNLNPSNTVLSTEGVVHIIDWENATGDYTPLSELGEIYTWNTGKDNISQFLAGYELAGTEVSEMMRDIQTLVLLRLLGLIQRKVTENNAWKQDAFIQDTIERITRIHNYQDDILFTKNL